MSSSRGDQAIEEVIIDVDDAPVAETTNHVTLFTAYFFQCVGSIATICRGLVTQLVRLLITYIAPGARFGEAMLLSHYALSFIITGLLGFAEIKSQGDSNFPFHTHPQAIMVSITSLLVYGFMSAAELVISGARVDPTSVYAIIARVGRIASMLVLVASLGCLFYL